MQMRRRPRVTQLRERGVDEREHPARGAAAHTKGAAPHVSCTENQLVGGVAGEVGAGFAAGFLPADFLSSFFSSFGSGFFSRSSSGLNSTSYLYIGISYCQPF